VGVARPQQRRDQVPRVAVEDEQGMVDVLLEVTVVVGAFLIAVGGVVRGIEVQHDLLRGAAFSPLSQIEFEDGSGYPVATAPRSRILRPRDGRLACQLGPVLGQGAANHLEQGIFAQAVRG
jgi:hypothetical protein